MWVQTFQRNRLHLPIWQKTANFRVTAVRTSDSQTAHLWILYQYFTKTKDYLTYSVASHVLVRDEVSAWTPRTWQCIACLRQLYNSGARESWVRCNDEMVISKEDQRNMEENHQCHFIHHTSHTKSPKSHAAYWDARYHLSYWITELSSYLIFINIYILFRCFMATNIRTK
jgi:hypothetical protein